MPKVCLFGFPAGASNLQGWAIMTNCFRGHRLYINLIFNLRFIFIYHVELLISCCPALALRSPEFSDPEGGRPVLQ